MILKYESPRKPTIKGPLIYIDQGQAYSIPLGCEVDIPEPVAHKILSQYSDIVKVVEEKKETKSAKPAQKNKMVSQSPANKLQSALDIGF